jgi:putative addiction module component (TIGR02574 family)
MRPPEEIPKPCALAIGVLRDYNDLMEPSFDQMTPAERILYVQDLWDRIAPEAEKAPLSAAQAAEIDRRVADYRAHPETSIPWEVAREQMRRRL